MAIQILDNCAFDNTKLKTLFVGSKQTNDNPISYPIQYITVSGSNDSIIAIEAWDYYNSIITIGGQDILLNEITNLGDNITFGETLVINQNGKIYQKSLRFVIPKLNTFLVNQIKNFVISSSGEVALAPTLALLIDENDNQLLVGFDHALYLTDNDINIGETNEIALSYVSTSMGRSKNWQLI